MAKKKGLPLGEFLKLFSSERQCREFLESMRWRMGFVCPKCGCQHSYRLSNGLRQCAQCRRQTSVTAGTVLHRSHVRLTTWFLAFYLVCCDKRGISAVQLAAQAGVTYKTAWYMLMRIRATRSIGWKALLSLTMRTLGAQPQERSGGVAQKRRKFLWRCPWMLMAIPAI